MSRINKRLDELLKQRWHEGFRRMSVYAGVFLLLLMSIIAYSTGETKIIEVPVISIYSEASEETGARFYVVVKLNQITTKRLQAPRVTAVKVGDKVNVIERQTNFFNLKRYTFQKVVR